MALRRCSAAEAVLVVRARPTIPASMARAGRDRKEGLLADAFISTRTAVTRVPLNSTVLRADPTLPPCSAVLSTVLMDRLGLTLGEVVFIQGEP